MDPHRAELHNDRLSGMDPHRAELHNDRLDQRVSSFLGLRYIKGQTKMSRHTDLKLLIDYYTHIMIGYDIIRFVPYCNTAVCQILFETGRQSCHFFKNALKCIGTRACPTCRIMKSNALSEKIRPLRQLYMERYTMLHRSWCCIASFISVLFIFSFSSYLSLSLSLCLSLHLSLFPSPSPSLPLHIPLQKALHEPWGHCFKSI